MSFFSNIIRPFRDYWTPHLVGASLTLLFCIPLLWQGILPHAWQGMVGTISGWVVFLTPLFCLTLLLLAMLRNFYCLKNKKALARFTCATLAWGGAVFIFILMSEVANLPKSVAYLNDSGDVEEVLTPNDFLNGPSALHLRIEHGQFSSENIAKANNLESLASNHSDFLAEYLRKSPRWKNSSSENFYTQPGHVVMTPNAQSGIQGVVHVAFCRMSEGEHIPRGFVSVKPGDPMPKSLNDLEKETHVPDLALALGNGHFLMLAWRGSSRVPDAVKTLNGAISTLNARFESLATTPNADELELNINLKRSYSGNETQLKLSEPPSQYGTYQAEIYANPGQEGTLVLAIIEKGNTLRVINTIAQYSDNPEELFRHDIPVGQAELMKLDDWKRSGGRLKEDSSLFSVKDGEPHQHFIVTFELSFYPLDSDLPRRVLLKRKYKVQACNYNMPQAQPQEKEQQRL